MFEQFTSAARAVIADARQRAVDEDAAEIREEHLLAALLAVPKVAYPLERLGVAGGAHPPVLQEIAHAGRLEPVRRPGVGRSRDRAGRGREPDRSGVGYRRAGHLPAARSPPVPAAVVAPERARAAGRAAAGDRAGRPGAARGAPAARTHDPSGNGRRCTRCPRCHSGDLARCPARWLGAGAGRVSGRPTTYS